MNTPPRSSDTPRGLWAGAGVIAIFAVIAVLVRGIRWDEGYEHAQILAGQVVYPPGHPLPYYLNRAFSLQTHGLAWLMMAGAGPVLVNGLRNVLFLLATLLPPYLFGAQFTGRISWGFAAALIFLQGSYLEFDGSYPLAVWPQLYSNGPIGGGFALITLYLGLAGYGRAAALCFGLMPAIHLGQFPPLLALAPLGLWQYRRYTRKGAATHPYDWLAIGGIGCALLWVYLQYLQIPPPRVTISGDCKIIDEPEELWRFYTFHLDPHRRLPNLNGHLIMVATLILGALIAVRGDVSRRQRIANGMTLYVSVISMLVWGIVTLHQRMGEELPYLFIAWMPYRLINQLPAVLLALCIYALVSRSPKTGTAIVGAALLFGVLQPWMAFVLPDSINARYVTGGEGVAYFLWGAAAMAAGTNFAHAKHRRIGVIALPLCIAVLAPFHQFGSFCIVVGCAAFWIGERILATKAFSQSGVFRSEFIGGGRLSWKMAALVFVSASMLVLHQARYRSWLPVTALDQALMEVVDQRHNVILLPPDTYAIQAKTNRPIAFDAATLSLVSYVPKLAPEIAGIYTSLYGVHPLRETIGSTSAPPDWRSIWAQRSPTDWCWIAKRYDLGTLVASVDLPLNIPDKIEVDGYFIYDLTSTFEVDGACAPYVR